MPSDPAAPAPVLPVAPARLAAGHKSRRPLLVLGGLALAAIVGVFAYMNISSTLTNGGSGRITFTPSTASCGPGTALTAPGLSMDARLPSSMTSKDVNQQDAWQWQVDGTTMTTGMAMMGQPRFLPMIGDFFEATGQLATSGYCPSQYYPNVALGTHTMRVVDASGKLLAEGSFTLTP